VNVPADPHRSRAVLVGTSTYRDPSWQGRDLDAVRANLTDLGALLRDETCWGLPVEHCTIVPDPQMPEDLLVPIRKAAAEASDTLVVYYAGHGFLSVQDGSELKLTVGRSIDHDSLNAVGYRLVRDALLNSRARRKVVILDCCFAGAAVGTMGTAADQTPIEGTYVLAAVPPHDLAVAPRGARYTAFTGELIALLQDGIPDAGTTLTLDRIYDQLWRRLAARNLPTPSRSDLGTVGGLGLVRNKVHVPRPNAEVLSIDFGTSNTTAVLRLADGTLYPLLFDNIASLPSAVLLGPDGQIGVGGNAVRSAAAAPSAFEATPKRRVDDGTLLLNGVEVAVVDAIAAVLEHVADKAVKVLGNRPGRVVLTHPHTWGAARKAVLEAAAVKAGLQAPELVSEPIAAVSYLACRGEDVEPGQFVVLYDFGGGTFDVSTLRRKPASGGWEVARCNGLDIGGVNLDEAIMRWVGEQISAIDPLAWGRLSAPVTLADRRLRYFLLEDVRRAKERLSDVPSVDIYVTVLDRDLTLTRMTFESLVRDLVEETIRLTTKTIAGSTGPRQVAAVVLIGGSSRIPLIRHRLTEEIGVSPRPAAEPELVVAEGALHRLPATATTDEPPPGETTPSRRSRLAAACRNPANLANGAGFGVFAAALVGFTLPSSDGGLAPAVLTGGASALFVYAVNVALALRSPRP
jgi:actin-like ATPase involved in cell morphogenesis